MRYSLSNKVYKKGYGAIVNKKTGRFKATIIGTLRNIAGSMRPFARTKRQGYKRTIKVTPTRPY